MTNPSYHDLHVTTERIPRTSIFNLPYGLEVVCNRVGGWSLCFEDRVLAGEFHRRGLRLDVAGHVICDSLIEVGEGGASSPFKDEPDAEATH